MRIVAAGDGVVLRFERQEGELLVQLLGDTAEALQPGVLDDDDPVAQRLFPAAYPDDEQAQEAFGSLTETTLRSERIERAERCTAEIAAAPLRRRHLEVQLDATGAQRWLQAINDVRLALGTRIGVTDDDEQLVDPHDPEPGSRLAYTWLTAVQDGIVQALMR